MNKKGFTLTELLVVIAIIGVLSVIIIPNVVKVNEGINEKTYDQRKEYIIEAAEMYASNHPDIFANKDYTEIYVSELLLENYLEPDANDDSCDYKTDANGADVAIDAEYKLSSGCVTDPRYSTSMNDVKVKVTKKAVGIVAEFGDAQPGPDPESKKLTVKVCQGIKLGTFAGKYGTGADEYCECVFDYANDTVSKLVKKGTSTEVDACVLVSNNDTGSVDNWLKYGSSSANWRVVGLYRIPTESDATKKEIVAKIITSSVVD